MTDKYPNLPGHLTEFKDGGLQLTKEVAPPTTESILILGTAVDGPIMEPVKVDASSYEAVFGKITDDNGIPNGATLSLGFEEAYAGGCRDIRLMRISGATAGTVIKGTESKKVEDKLFESVLGVSTGNAQVASTFFLADKAVQVLEVQSNGVTLTADDYVVELAVEVAGKYTDGTLTYDVASLVDTHVLTGTKTEVVIASDDIYDEDITHAKVWGASLAGVFAGYTRGIISGTDYVLKGATTAEAAFIDPSLPGSVVVDAKATVTGIVVDKLVRTTVALKDSVSDNGCYVVVKYEDAEGNIPTENASDISGAYKTAGAPMEVVLVDEDGVPVIPVIGMTKVYFDGVEYTEVDTLTEDPTKNIFEIVRYNTTVDSVVIANAKIVTNPGRHAKRGSKIETRLIYKKTVSFVPEVKLQTSFGGLLYNETQYTVDSVVHAGNFIEKVIKIIKPKSKRAQASELPLTYSSNDYPTLGLLVRAITNDVRNMGFVRAVISQDIESTPTNKLNPQPTAKNFEGGEDGINLAKQDVFTLLSGKRDAAGGLIEPGAYQLLENYTVDYVVPQSIFADDALLGVNDDFAYELALYCAVASHRNHATMGVISTTSPVEATLKVIEEHVRKLEAYNNLYFMKDIKGDIIRDNENNPIDLGRHITLVAGGDILLSNTRLGVYATNSAAGVAGFVSALAVNSAPTNKVLTFAKGLKVKFSNAQLDRLTAKRMLTFKYKGNGSSVAIVDAMTCSKPNSDYARLSTMRAVREIANNIREVADPFLGEPNTVQQRNALSALIDKRLGLHKDAGTIKDYAFQIIADAYDELVGQATIELTLVPAQELRRITTIISLKPSL